MKLRPDRGTVLDVGANDRLLRGACGAAQGGRLVAVEPLSFNMSWLIERNWSLMIAQIR